MHIKYSFYLLSISFLFSFNSIAQKSEKEIKREEYINSILEKYHEDGSLSALQNMTDKEFNKLIKIAYEAIEAGQTEILNYEKANIPSRSSRYHFNREIYMRYSRFLEVFIRVPVIVKAKILESRQVIKGGFGQLNLILKPEYIIKGKEPFLSQPFEIYYREYTYVPDSIDFKIGKSYLFLLWDRGEPDNKEFSIATWADDSQARFLIENDILYDHYNFFNMGSSVKWADFVKNIEELIFRIKNENNLDMYKRSLQDKF